MPEKPNKQKLKNTRIKIISFFYPFFPCKTQGFTQCVISKSYSKRRWDFFLSVPRTITLSISVLHKISVYRQKTSEKEIAITANIILSIKITISDTTTAHTCNISVCLGLLLKIRHFEMARATHTFPGPQGTPWQEGSHLQCSTERVYPKSSLRAMFWLLSWVASSG